MRNRVILTSLLFLLTAVAMPAEASPKDCEEYPDDKRCQNNGNGGDIEEYCAKNPDSKRCARAIGEEICNIIKVHAGTPSLVWDPILGIIEFNPDECYEVFVYESHEENIQLAYYKYDY